MLIFMKTLSKSEERDIDTIHKFSVQNLWFQQIPAYILSSIAPLIVGIVNVSLLPRIMGSQTYGVYALVIITSNMVASVAGEWLLPSGIRLASDTRGNQIWNTLGWISFFCTLIAIIIVGMLLIKQSISISVWVAALFYTVTMVVSKPFIAYIRFSLQRKLVAGYALFSSLGSLIFGFGLYIIFKSLGWFIAGLSIIPFITFITYCLKFKCFLKRPELTAWKSILRFGLPIVITSIGGQLLQFVDRYMLALFKAYTDVGIYNIAYNLSDKLLGVGFSILFSSMYPVGTRVWSAGNQIEAKILLTNLFSFLGLFAGAFLWFQSVSGVSVIRWMAGNEFMPPSLIPMVVTLGSWLWYTGIIQHQPFEWDKRTIWITAMTLLSAILNLVLNWVLIPLWGMTGAAIATLISYAFYLTLCTLIGRIYYKVRVWRLRIVLGASLSALILWYLFRGNGLLWQGLLAAFLYVILYIALVGSKLFVNVLRTKLT